MFGICKDIAAADISDVTVTINGKPQEVKWGDNVELKTEEKPDHSTGCAGFKFDFPLSKTNGIMEVCFSLSKTYPVGSVEVCVFGGNTAATGLSICGPSCNGDSPCESVFFQRETVCVPVTVTQTLCIEVPISFGARVETGTATVTCGDVTRERRFF